MCSRQISGRLLILVTLALLLVPLVPAAPASASPLLREGSRGGAVVQLQSQLAGLRYDVGPVDGIFGPRTKRAVISFQGDAGLVRDGIVGPRTRAALGRHEAPAASRRPTSPTPTTSLLRQGARGTAVSQLQSQLAGLRYDVGPIDGHFGPQTRHAVVAFQKVNGLSRDGIVGPQTRAALQRPVTPSPRTSRSGISVEIDLGRQVLLVARNGTVTRIVDTSTGKPSTPTAVGTFTIQRRIDGWRHAPLGTLWRPAYFYGGQAIHGYASVPATPVSSGCARVPMASMNRMWSELQVGTPVQVYR